MTKQQAAEKYNGFLADKKVTYLMQLPPNFQTLFNKKEIEEYEKSSAN